MAKTSKPTITRVINEARREVVMSVVIDDGEGDVRTITGKGKAKTEAEGKRLLDGIVDRYKAEIAHEAVVATMKNEMEADAKTYLDEQLNG